MDNTFEYLMESVEYFDDYEYVTEGSVSDSWRLRCGDKMKRAKKLIKEAKREGDKKKADEAIKILKDLKKEANKIDDDNMLISFIRIFFVPFWVLVSEWMYIGDVTLSGLSRSMAMKVVDDTINAAERMKSSF